MNERDATYSLQTAPVFTEKQSGFKQLRPFLCTVHFNTCTYLVSVVPPLGISNKCDYIMMLLYITAIRHRIGISYSNKEVIYLYFRREKSQI